MLQISEEICFCHCSFFVFDPKDWRDWRVGHTHYLSIKLMRWWVISLLKHQLACWLVTAVWNYYYKSFLEIERVFEFLKWLSVFACDPDPSACILYLMTNKQAICKTMVHNSGRVDLIITKVSIIYRSERKRTTSISDRTPFSSFSALARVS